MQNIIEKQLGNNFFLFLLQFFSTISHNWTLGNMNTIAKNNWKATCKQFWFLQSPESNLLCLFLYLHLRKMEFIVLIRTEPIHACNLSHFFFFFWKLYPHLYNVVKHAHTQKATYYCNSINPCSFILWEPLWVFDTNKLLTLKRRVEGKVYQTSLKSLSENYGRVPLFMENSVTGGGIGLHYDVLWV